MSLHRLQGSLAEAGVPDQLLQDVGALDVMQVQRMHIALRAARFVVDECQGTTTNADLYYLAMFGRSCDEGISERDKNRSVPTGMATLLGSSAVGDPVALHAPEYPDMNITVGRLASFSDAEFQPTKFNVDIEKDKEGFTLWRGSLAVAMHEVVPVRVENSTDFTYRLADEVLEATTCETSTWTGNRGLEIVPRGSGGIEIGDEMRINSEFGHDGRRLWLYRQLAPTGRQELTPELQRTQLSERRLRQHIAIEQGMDESVVAAQGLPPTTETFFRTVQQHASADEPPVINERALFQDWHDPYDARNLLTSLEVRELVQPNDKGQLVLSALGRDALLHLDAAQH